VCEDRQVTHYERPAIDAPVFLDADGRVIDYGRRWSGSPPEETYSVDTHPERFAPLHTVADALIVFLWNTYDLALVEGSETATDLLHPARDVLRSVRLQPNDPTSAALTIVYTAYPGIFLHAGALHDSHYPVCGCDACDTNWDGEADELERHVLAAATGQFRENIDMGPLPWVEHAFTYSDGRNAGRFSTRDLPVERVTAAQQLLGTVPEPWAAWPLRSA